MTKSPAINQQAQEFINLTRDIFGDGFIPLHRPIFSEVEKQYLSECIDKNFVSSAGENITLFERQVADYTGARYAIATATGTAALHTALHLAGVEAGMEVITQALSFVATANAISYCGAMPVFIDVDEDTMGMSPDALKSFLLKNAEIKEGRTVNRQTGAILAACVPMHSFGHPVRVEEIAAICAEYQITLIEDCAESLGSYAGKKHTGRFGSCGIFSFNGNKIITTGGGGMIITDDEAFARRAKHITTTAKRPHAYEYFHDELGFNYRMPNLNATLGRAQMEKLPQFLAIKRDISQQYQAFFEHGSIDFFAERSSTTANFWLNCIFLPNLAARNEFLEITNAADIMTRPVWNLLNTLPMYHKCQTDGLHNSLMMARSMVNIPSSVPTKRWAEA